MELGSESVSNDGNLLNISRCRLGNLITIQPGTLLNRVRPLLNTPVLKVITYMYTYLLNTLPYALN